jgi:PAS domain S-box-containing protein
MIRIRNLSIRNKIIFMVLTATIPALLLSSSIFLYNDLKLLKQEIIRNLTVLGSVVADNSRSSLYFDDSVMASKILASFKTEPQIVSAAIFDSKDKIFAKYISDGWPQFEDPTTLEIGRVIDTDCVEMVMPVILENVELGKIYLHAKLLGYKSRKRNILYFSGLTFIGVLIVSFLITIKLQGVISKPILALAETANVISESSNYSLRAGYKGKDEIGKLYSGFNEMLLQIENRDNQLEAYGKNLEEKIFESEQYADKLLKSEEKFRQLTENIKEVFWMENFAGTEILYVSPAFEEIWGIPCEDMYKKPSIWMESIHPEDRQKVDDVSFYKNRQLLLEGKYKIEFRIVRPDGAIRWILDRAFPVFNEKDEPIRICGIAQDITDRKKIEEDLENSQKKLLHAEKLSATGKLSASIAHEFNNPIYGIRNVLEMISEEVPLDRSQQVFINLAVKECNRMKDLILKLQDFHRPTSGVITLIDINKLIDETSLWINKRLKEKKVILERKYDENLPKFEGVFDQIKQVILNLLQNAEEAIPKEGGIISIKTESHSSVIKIEIQDSGMGVDPENIQKIFEPFFTKKSLVTGTGLGLSLSYGIIKAHGGDIEVESHQGQGTKFIISLPIKRKIA